MQGKIEQTEEYRDFLERRNPEGLVCFEKGYHEVESLKGTKYIPELDDKFNWFRCTVCSTITFTKK